jgi:hypothetical protein
MRKTKLPSDLFAQQDGNDGLFARFYRHPESAILLQKHVSKASIAKMVCVSLPPLYEDKAVTPTTLKGYFYTNLGGTLRRRVASGDASGRTAERFYEVGEVT